MAGDRIRGESWKRLRQEAELSQAEVARRVSVWDSASIRAWERDAQQASPAKIPLLAAGLGVKPLDLFELIGPPSLGVLRRAAGLTLTGLATRAGLAYAECQKLEKGQPEGPRMTNTDSPRRSECG